MGKTIGVILSLKDMCSPAIVNIAKKMGIAENEANKLNAALKKQAKTLENKLQGAIQASTIAIGAVTAATSALIVNTGKTCDRIDDMSNRIGISRQGFQEWDYLLKQNGGEIESLQMGFKTLVNQVSKANSGNKEAAKLFKTLGISIKDSNGKLKSQEQIFNELVPKLQKMPEGVKKAKLANELLGKSGVALMPLLNATTEQLERQKKEYEKLGIAISDDVIDEGNRLGDNIEKWQAVLGSLGAVVTADLIPMVNELSDTIIGHLPEIKAALAPVISTFGEAIGFVCQNLDVIIPAIGTLVGVVTGLQVIGSIAGLVAAFATPLGLVVTIVGSLIAAFGVARAKGIGFFEALKLIFRTVEEGIGTVIKLAKALGKLFFGKKDIDINVKDTADKQNVKHNALGTSSFQGGLSVVGEYGPELVNLNRGASVTPANQTKQLLQNSGSKIEVHVNVAGNIIGEEDFFNKIVNKMTLELNKVIPV